jgi:hypothetical protein
MLVYVVEPVIWRRMSPVAEASVAAGTSRPKHRLGSGHLVDTVANADVAVGSQYESLWIEGSSVPKAAMAAAMGIQAIIRFKWFRERLDNAFE